MVIQFIKNLANRRVVVQVDRNNPLPVECTQAPAEMTEVDLAADADVVVCPVPCVLLGLYVNAGFSAHPVNILDGAATKLTLPASSAAGAQWPGYSSRFATNLTVNSDNAATGKLVVCWRAL